MLYIKENKIIEATEKAYNLIYKARGFEEYVIGPHVTNSPIEGLKKGYKESTNTIDYQSMTKAEIGQILSKKGIEYNPRDKKEKLIELLIEGD